MRLLYLLVCDPDFPLKLQFWKGILVMSTEAILNVRVLLLSGYEQTAWFVSQLCTHLAVWPGTGHLTSLCFHLIVYAMEMITTAPRGAPVRLMLAKWDLLTNNYYFSCIQKKRCNWFSIFFLFWQEKKKGQKDVLGVNVLIFLRKKLMRFQVISISSGNR